MNGLKQRIIGALVLVSLAVIFVPMMFDEPHSERETTTIQIPEEPPFPEVEMPEPETTEVPPYRIEETAPAGPDDGSGRMAERGDEDGRQNGVRRILITERYPNIERYYYRDYVTCICV